MVKKSKPGGDGYLGTHSHTVVIGLIPFPDSTTNLSIPDYFGYTTLHDNLGKDCTKVSFSVVQTHVIFKFTYSTKRFLDFYRLKRQIFFF